MTTYYNPVYKFKLVDFDSNTSNPNNQTKYLFIDVYDQNRECNKQKFSFFISLKDFYMFNHGLLITIGNNCKEINLRHYEIDKANDSYDKLKCLLNLNL